MGKKLSELNQQNSATQEEYLLIDKDNAQESHKIKLKDIDVVNFLNGELVNEVKCAMEELGGASLYDGIQKLFKNIPHTHFTNRITSDNTTQAPTVKAVYDYILENGGGGGGGTGTGGSGIKEKVDNPKLWELTSGMYEVTSGFYYTVDNYQSLENTSAILFIGDDSPEQDINYFMIAGRVKYYGVMKIDGSDGTIVTEDFSNEEISENSTNKDIPSSKAVYDFVTNEINAIKLQTVDKPKLWELESGIYEITNGFYYQIDKYQEMTTGIMLISQGFGTLYHIFQGGYTSYNGEIYNNGNNGFCNKTEIVSSVSDTSTNKDIPTAKSVFDFVTTFVDSEAKVKHSSNPKLWELDEGWHYITQGFYLNENDYFDISGQILIYKTYPANTTCSFYGLGNVYSTQTNLIYGSILNINGIWNCNCNVERFTEEIDADNPLSHNYPSEKAVVDFVKQQIKNSSGFKTITEDFELNGDFESGVYIVNQGVTISYSNEQWTIADNETLFIIHNVVDNNNFSGVMINALPEDNYQTIAMYRCTNGEWIINEVLTQEHMLDDIKDAQNADDKILTAKAIYDALLESEALYEKVDNKTDTISKYSSNTTYPTSKAVYDYVGQQISSLVDTAPDTLNTLNELAEALGNDENFAATVMTQIGERVTKEDFDAFLSEIGRNDTYTIYKLSNTTDWESILPAITTSTDKTDYIYKFSTNGRIIKYYKNKSDTFFTPSRSHELIYPYDTNFRGCGVINNSIYYLIVDNDQVAICCFDIETEDNYILRYTSMNFTSSTISAIDNCLYIFGGDIYNASGEREDFTSVYKYDIETDELTNTGIETTYNKEVVPVVVDDKIYTFGGSEAKYNSKVDGYDCIRIIDTTNNSFTELPMKGSLWSYYAPAVIDKKIYLFAGNKGISSNLSYNTNIYVFNTIDNSMKQLDIYLPLKVVEPVTAVVDTVIYILGGTSEDGATNHNQVFTLTKGEKTKLVKDVDSFSTHLEYPTAKAVYDFVSDKIDIPMVTNPIIGNLSDGIYHLKDGFYYGTGEENYQRLDNYGSDNLLFVSGSKYFVFAENTRYYGTAYSGYSGTCKIEKLVTEINKYSTNEEYPSAKAVFDFVNNNASKSQILSEDTNLVDLETGSYISQQEHAIRLFLTPDKFVFLDGCNIINQRGGKLSGETLLGYVSKGLIIGTISEFDENDEPTNYNGIIYYQISKNNNNDIILTEFAKIGNSDTEDVYKKEQISGEVSLLDLDTGIYYSNAFVAPTIINITNDRQMTLGFGQIINYNLSAQSGEESIRMCNGVIFGVHTSENDDDRQSIIYYSIMEQNGEVNVVQFTDLIEDFLTEEDFLNKLQTTISSSSTDNTIPTAKAVYDYFSTNAYKRQYINSSTHLHTLGTGIYEVSATEVLNQDYSNVITSTTFKPVDIHITNYKIVEMVSGMILHHRGKVESGVNYDDVYSGLIIGKFGNTIGDTDKEINKVYYYSGYCHLGTPYLLSFIDLTGDSFINEYQITQIINADSTHSQIPTAKAVYENLEQKSQVQIITWEEND